MVAYLNAETFCISENRREQLFLAYHTGMMSNWDFTKTPDFQTMMDRMDRAKDAADEDPADLEWEAYKV